MRGYFDESGTHEQSLVTTIAGWVSNATNWRKCLIEWQVVLDKQYIGQFHASDYKQLAPEFIETLTGIITKYAFFGVSGSVVTSAYNNLPQWVKKRVGGRYHFCFYVLMNELAKRMHNMIGPEQLTLVFEIKDDATGRALDNLRRDFSHRDFAGQQLDGFYFGSKEKFPLLQTADFLVYEMNRWITEALVQRKPPRTAIKHLARSRKVRFGYHDEETLSGWPALLGRDRKELEAGMPEGMIWWPESWHKSGSLKHPKPFVAPR